MGMVRMVNPDDGKTYKFDSKYAKEYAGKGWTVALTPPQSMAKMVGDVLPAATGTLGTVAGFGAGAAGTLPVAGVGGWPGAVVGGTAGSLMGAAGREAIYNMAGIPRNTSPMAQAGRLAGEGAYGILGSGLQAAPMAGAAAANRAAPSAMKGAIGNAQPGVEDVLLREGIEVSPAGAAKIQRTLGTSKAEKAAAINAAERQGVKWTWKHLRQVIAGRRKTAEASDVVSPANEEAMNRALRFLEGKLGPRTVGGKTLKTLDQYGNPTVVPGKQLPAQELTPKRLEAIRRWSDAQVKSYEAARRNPQGVATGMPTADEQAYRAIADESRNLLNALKAGKPGRTVGDINKRISELVDAERTVFASRKRSPGVHVAATAGGAMAGMAPALWTHRPEYLLASVPAALVGHMATDPASLSRLSLLLKNAGLMGKLGLGAGVATRAPELGARIMGVGSPEVTP